MSFSALVNLGVVGEDISGYTVSISGCTGNTCQSGCSSLTTGQSVNSFPKSIDNIPDGVNSLYINVDDGPCAGTNQCIDLTFIYITPTPTPTNTPTLTPTNTPTLTPTNTPTLTPTPTSPPIQLTINWELFENVDLANGGDPNNFVDGNMKIFVNGAQVIEIFTENTGSFTVNSGDLIMVEYFYYNASQGGGVSAGIINPKIELVIGGTLIASNVIDPNVSATYNHTFTATSNTSILVRSIGDVSTPIATPTPTPTTNTFSDVPFGGGIKGALFVTQGSNYSVILTGSPFSMSPFQVTPTSINPSAQECNNCKSVINFINTERTENIISFTLGGTFNASAYTNLIIIDNLNTSYSGTFQNGSNNIGTTPDNKIISFNIGSQKGRVFKFLGGEVNLQFI
jgi:hypothetical protein